MNDQLPMIVWLSGEDPIFSDFSLDADAVMQLLGIKRTRLTQISGRELRVGRAKQDRYIKPFYRPKDVEDYLNWTKATSTSKKSSELVQEAASLLAQESTHLKESLSAPLDRVAEHLSAQINHISHMILQSIEKDFKKKLLEFQTKISSSQAAQNQDIKAIHSFQNKLLRELSLKEDHAKVLLELAYIHKELATKISFLENQMQDLKLLLTPKNPVIRIKAGPSKRMRVRAIGDDVSQVKRFSRKSRLQNQIKK